MMNAIDLTPYINEKGMARIDDLLKDLGYVEAEEVLATRIDTVAIAQVLHISLKTLYTYIGLELIELGPDRRMPLKKVLRLNFKELQREAKLRKSVPVKRQNRGGKRQ